MGYKYHSSWGTFEEASPCRLPNKTSNVPVTHTICATLPTGALCTVHTRQNLDPLHPTHDETMGERGPLLLYNGSQNTARGAPVPSAYNAQFNK